MEPVPFPFPREFLAPEAEGRAGSSLGQVSVRPVVRRSLSMLGLGGLSHFLGRGQQPLRLWGQEGSQRPVVGRPLPW